MRLGGAARLFEEQVEQEPARGIRKGFEHLVIERRVTVIHVGRTGDYFVTCQVSVLGWSNRSRECAR